jgi:hypothetical protein
MEKKKSHDSSMDKAIRYGHALADAVAYSEKTGHGEVLIGEMAQFDRKKAASHRNFLVLQAAQRPVRSNFLKAETRKHSALSA